MQEKRTLQVKQVLADIRSGMSPDDLMGKYGLSTKGLQSLLGKLTESGLLSENEIAQCSSTKQVPETPLKPRGGNQPPQSQVLADIRAGANFQQIMQEYNFSAESLQKILAQMLFAGLLEPAEAANLQTPPKLGSNMSGSSPTTGIPTSHKIAKAKPKETNWRRIKVWAAVLPIIIILIAGGGYGVGYYLDVKEKQEKLIAACTSGDADLAALLVSEGTNADTTDPHGDSTLIMACRNGHPNVVKLLLEKRADPNFKPLQERSTTVKRRLQRLFGRGDRQAETQHRDSPLMAAVSAGHVQVVELLLDKGAAVNSENVSGKTALDVAYDSGQAPMEALLKSGGAKQGALLRQERMLDAANAGDLETLKVVLSKKTDANFRDSHGDTALILAVRQGHRDAVKALLEHGADIELRDSKENKTALMWASLREDTEIVNLLLQKGANPQAATSDGKTPFSVAASKGDKAMLSSFLKEGRKIDTASLNEAFLRAATDGRTEVAESLIDSGADVNAKDIHGQTALFRASTPKFVKLLLEKGANVTAVDKDGLTPLMVAIREGRPDMTSVLTENGADINSTTKDGQTPLMIASLKGSTELVRYLVEKGADVNARDKRGLTSLIFPAISGRIDLVKFLVERGADVNVTPSQGNPPVVTAYDKGDMDMFKLLLEKGADPNSKRERGLPLLFAACDKRDANAVKLLLEKGADINSKDERGQPLVVTVYTTTVYTTNDNDTVKLLLEKGADPNSKNEQGHPLVIVAYNKGDTGIVNLLLEKGADVNSLNRNGETVLMFAAAKGDTDMARTLLEKGADIKSRDKQGNTALIKAVIKGDRLMTEILLDKGAEINATTNDGKTCLMVAASTGRTELVKFLLEKGADIEAADKKGRTAVGWALANRHAQLAKFLAESMVKKRVPLKGTGDDRKKETLGQTGTGRR